MSIDPQRVQAVFLAAMDLPPAEREAYLERECYGDGQLRERVEALLKAGNEPGSFLDSPPPGVEATELRPLTEQPGDHIGPYKLLQQIGEGGMGVVYMAEQTEPVERRVALKIIKPGMDTQQVIARFEAERQALAMMDHPNIAKVLDAGTTDSGRPYFVMELVKGIPVTQYCDEQHLTPKERLELFIPICHAVQHAHQKGIIHRDLKPCNILVAQYDNKPVPKIIDFGVAKAVSHKLTEKTMFTQYGQIVGTIEYMSPEQARFNQLDVDTRSDIYSLGVLLYELLTGETPFDKQRLRSAAFDELLRIIRDEEPPRPSTKLSSSQSLPNTAVNRKTEPKKLSLLVRGDLDWIVMKALEKDRNRRYETASKFAEDVAHYLNDEPVAACPPSAAYKFRKFAKRNKVVIGTTAAIATSVVVGIIGTTWQAMEAIGERDRALIAEGKARDEADRANRTEAEIRLEKQKLERALERESALLTSEQEQHRRADHNFALAREAVDKFLTHMSTEELGHLPGLEPVKQELLSSALPFYEQFVAENEDNPELRLALAEAYLAIGNVLSSLGDHTSTLKNLKKAHALFAQLLDADPGNVNALRNIAFMDNIYLGRYDEAIEIYRKLLKEDPVDESIVLPLVQALQHKVNAYMSEEVAECRELLIEAESLARAVLQRNPDGNAANKLSFILNSRGVVELRAGNRELAMEYYESSANVGIASLKQRPYQIKLGRQTATAASNLSSLHASLGNQDQALAWRERQVEVARLLAYSNPLVSEVWPELLEAYQQLGSQQLSNGDARGARMSLLRAEAISDNLDQKGFNDLVVLALTYHSLSRLSLTEDGHNSWATERSYYRELCAVTIRKAMSKYNSKVTSFRAKQACYVCENLSWYFSTTDVIEERNLAEAVWLAQQAVKLAAQNASAWQSLGWAQYRTGNWADSLDSLQTSCTLQKDGKGDYGQWFVMALAHWKLSIQSDLPDPEKAMHRAESKRLYELAAQQTRRWGTKRPTDPFKQAIWDFRREAKALITGEPASLVAPKPPLETNANSNVQVAEPVKSGNEN